jgi:hypothetical protein
LRAKRATFAALKNVRSFVFKYFLASFPLFFIFCSSLLSPLARTVSPFLAPRRSAASAYDRMSIKRPLL